MPGRQTSPSSCSARHSACLTVLETVPETLRKIGLLVDCILKDMETGQMQNCARRRALVPEEKTDACTKCSATRSSQ